MKSIITDMEGDTFYVCVLFIRSFLIFLFFLRQDFHSRLSAFAYPVLYLL